MAVSNFPPQRALFAQPGLSPRSHRFLEAVSQFGEFGGRTHRGQTAVDGQRPVPTFTNEFWTSRQRQGHSLHEVSYRACFKPQLPGFFLSRLSERGDLVYDPFVGRGTTPLEAGLLGRRVAANDINPLSERLLRPRLCPPRYEDVLGRLEGLDLRRETSVPPELGLEVFYHPETLKEIASLRAYLLEREAGGELDEVDAWIRMVAVNRLTGHSSGFFSVYTLPPNQAVTASAQRAINARRSQVPSPRPIVERILRKSRSLLRDVDAPVRQVLAQAEPLLLRRPAADTPELTEGTVDLVVTSPPFLDVVDYATDNWLRCWFCGIDPGRVPLTQAKGLASWQEEMTRVFHELRRVLKPGGHVAFEVGEVRGGTVKLEELVLPAGLEAGLLPVLVMINSQAFTKTANCWGVQNQVKGTNTNRICVFVKE